ncbi:hypothetical protein Tco_0349328 [Tanacetum coccineum]
MDSPFDLVAYTDSDYIGASLDRKSTIGGYQFLGCWLISWQCKKQTVVANSITKAEYIAASNCCGQATAKVKTVNGEVQIQALVDKKKLTLMGYENLTQNLTFYKAFFSPQWKFLIHTILQCLSAKTTAWNEFSSTMASAVICFSGTITPLFPTMIVQAQEQVGEGSEKKQSRRKHRKDTKDHQLSGPTEPVTDDTRNVASVPTHSNDPLLSGEDRLQLNELMELCTSLSQRVLDLEKIKTSQAVEITKLKKRVKKLEGKKKNDEEMFDTGILDGEEVFAEQDVVKKEVSTTEVTTDSTTTTVDELTLAQTLIEIKAAKPKAVTTTTTTTTTAVTRPKL